VQNIAPEPVNRYQEYFREKFKVTLMLNNDSSRVKVKIIILTTGKVYE
jgi:hypothetical protein